METEKPRRKHAGQGGARRNSGRKKRFTEPTKRVRIPTRLSAHFNAWLKGKMDNGL